MRRTTEPDAYAARMLGPSPDPAAPAVAVRDLTVAYGDHVALRSVDVSLPPGCVTAVIGPNGSGKTTLLRALSGLERPTVGEVVVLGRPAGSDHAAVAHVMQAQTVNDAVPVTVLETVRMGRYARRGLVGRLHADDHRAVDDAIDRMALRELVHRHLRELSGGQRQRVFVAQGLAQQAHLVLLDEPITGLDIVSQDRIERAVAEEVAAGRTVVMTTHDVATAARADHVLLLATHLVAAGAPDEVLTEDHLGHAYGGTAFRTAEGTLVIGDPHVHGTTLEGHEHH
jgi:ABC-type Mn2+/Zn2+ transport system ATPase subunit